MAWLVEQKLCPGWNCIEHSYEETVQVVNGRGLVQHQSTVNFLNSCGYDAIRELPPLEELETEYPELCAELAEMGLGPWAGKPAEELAALVGTTAT